MVNVWRGQAEHLAESLGKGDRVMVTGRLRQRSWETSDGDKRSVTEIEADEVGASLKWARPSSSGPASAATATAPRVGSGRPNAATSTTRRPFERPFDAVRAPRLRPGHGMLPTASQSVRLAVKLAEELGPCYCGNRRPGLFLAEGQRVSVSALAPGWQIRPQIRLA
jgi:single-stranded DNA-binding protein